MTAFAKWSVFGLCVLGALVTLVRSLAKRQTPAEVYASMVGLSVHAWFLTAILVWWHA